VPRALGTTTARSSIQISTVIAILRELPSVKTERDYLALLCSGEELKKYRNKLDERRLLRELNEHNKYPLRTTISGSERKFFVLVQSELDGRHIEGWELRKQAKDAVHYLRRLVYCVRCASNELQLFWPCYWSWQFAKSFSLGFWVRNEQMEIRQFDELNEKWKMLAARGFKNIAQVGDNLGMLDSVCQRNGGLGRTIGNQLNNLREGIVIECQKIGARGRHHQLGSKADLGNDEEDDSNETTQPCSTLKDTLVVIKFTGFFDHKLKSITVIVSKGSELYTTRTLK
jgi:hypothetical protein